MDILKIYFYIHIYKTNDYILINFKNSLHDTYYILFYF